MTLIFSALTTTTKSPVSTWGVYSGLRLPRSVSAIRVASRPRVLPSASTTIPVSLAVGGCGDVGLHDEKPRRKRPARRADDSGPPPAAQACLGTRRPGAACSSSGLPILPRQIAEFPPTGRRGAEEP